MISFRTTQWSVGFSWLIDRLKSTYSIDRPFGRGCGALHKFVSTTQESYDTACFRTGPATTTARQARKPPGVDCSITEKHDDPEKRSMLIAAIEIMLTTLE